MRKVSISIVLGTVPLLLITFYRPCSSFLSAKFINRCTDIPSSHSYLMINYNQPSTFINKLYNDFTTCCIASTMRSTANMPAHRSRQHLHEHMSRHIGIRQCTSPCAFAHTDRCIEP